MPRQTRIDPSDPTQNARQFVDAVYRRLVVLRCVESLGQGFLIASILAILLIGVTIWQSMPTGPILGGCGCLGIVLGIALSITHWPRRWIAAVETDRQLKLNDLLTTALSCTESSDEFQAVVIASANARCEMHTPSQVLLRQWGIRSWSGIGLAMGIAITLAIIPLGPSKLQADDANSSVLLSENPVAPPAARALQQSRGPIAVNGRPIDESASNSAIPAEQTPAEHPPTQAHFHNDPSRSASTIGNSSTAAGGSASTDAKSSQTIEWSDSASGSQNSRGAAAGGGSSPADGSGQAAASGVSGRGGTSPALAPQWAGDSRLDPPDSLPVPADQIPPEDRDLVQRFFQKP